MKTLFPIAATLLLSALTGCGPSMFAVSTPPPTRSPLQPLRRRPDQAEPGVALAFDCADI
jgi:hypothetical protein